MGSAVYQSFHDKYWLHHFGRFSLESKRFRTPKYIFSFHSIHIKIESFKYMSIEVFFFFSKPIFCSLWLQATYVLFRDDGLLKLPYCIAIGGFVCAMFAICIPHLSALGIWLGFSTVFSLAYIVISFVLSLKDGNKLPLLCLSLQVRRITSSLV